MDGNVRRLHPALLDKSEIPSRKDHLITVFNSIYGVINNVVDPETETFATAWEVLWNMYNIAETPSALYFELIYKHTIRLILRPEWSRRKNTLRRLHLSHTIRQFSLLLEKLRKNDDAPSDDIISKSQRLELLVVTPWFRFIRELDKPVRDFNESVDFFLEENEIVTMIRLETMLERRCTDLAVRLAKWCLNTCLTGDGSQLPYENDFIDHIRDIYWCSLLKLKRIETLVEEVDQFDLERGIELLGRFRHQNGVGKGLPTFNRNSNLLTIWKYGNLVIHVVAVTLLGKAVVQLEEPSETTIVNLLTEWAAIQTWTLTDMSTIARLILTAESSTRIYPFCEFFMKTRIALNMLSDVVTWLLRAVLIDLNGLETCQANLDHGEIISHRERLAKGFSLLADLFSDHPSVSRECRLSAFNFSPTIERLQRLQSAFEGSTPVGMHAVQAVDELTPDPAYYVELGTMNLEENLKEDLSTVLRCKRFHTLSCDLDWNVLRANCVEYFEIFQTFFEEVELKYLKLDYHQFQHIPIDPSAGYGIEPGYEHALPEDINNDALLEPTLSDATEMPYGPDSDSDEEYIEARKQRKTTHRKRKKGRSKSKSRNSRVNRRRNRLLRFERGRRQAKKSSKKMRVLRVQSNTPSKKTDTFSLSLVMTENLPPDIYNQSPVQAADPKKNVQESIGLKRKKLDVISTNTMNVVDQESVLPTHGRRLTMKINLREGTSQLGSEDQNVDDVLNCSCEVRLQKLKFTTEEFNGTIKYRCTGNSSPDSSAAMIMVDNPPPPIKPIVVQRFRIPFEAEDPKSEERYDFRIAKSNSRMERKVLISDDSGSFGSTDTSPADALEELPLPFETIAGNVHTIESNCRFLEQASKAIGTMKDSLKLRNNVQSTLFASKTIIDQTKTELQGLVLESRRKDKHYKLQLEKLKNRFQDCVAIYSHLQQVLFIKLRRNLPSDPCPITQSENKRVDYIYDDQEELLSLQQSFQKTLEEKQGEIIEREDAIRKIESDMLDINDIMRDLGTMIESQGDKLDLIENVIEETHGNVESGRQEIEKATGYLNRRRRKIILLFVLLLIIIGVLAVVMYFTLNQH